MLYLTNVTTNISMNIFIYICRENRLPEAVEVTADDKVDLKPWKDRWVLIYSSALRRWRPGIVTST